MKKKKKEKVKNRSRRTICPLIAAIATVFVIIVVVVIMVVVIRLLIIAPEEGPPRGSTGFQPPFSPRVQTEVDMNIMFRANLCREREVVVVVRSVLDNHRAEHTGSHMVRWYGCVTRSGRLHDCVSAVGGSASAVRQGPCSSIDRFHP